MCRLYDVVFRRTTCYDLVNLDVFSGGGAIYNAFRERGHAAEYYEITHRGPANDLTTERGFYEAILSVLRLRADGLMTLGPPCGSFVWISSSSHGWGEHKPYGLEDKEWVNIGSMLAARTLLLVILATCRGAYVTLEQPANSRKVFP